MICKFKGFIVLKKSKSLKIAMMQPLIINFIDKNSKKIKIKYKTRTIYLHMILVIIYARSPNESIPNERHMQIYIKTSLNE